MLRLEDPEPWPDPVDGARLLGELARVFESYLVLAEGAADIYPRLAPTSEWDIAAGEAILVAAGGVVQTPDGGLPEYGRANRDFRVSAFIGWGDPAATTTATV